MEHLMIGLLYGANGYDLLFWFVIALGASICLVGS